MVAGKQSLPVLFFAIVVLAFFVRSLYLWRDFVFVYDQGRDALAVQEILSGNPTLIGPTTGLSGVFLGPFFYYFLLPFYIIGRGNPIVPAYGIIFFHALATGLMLLFAKKYLAKGTGVIASLLFALSFSQLLFARWLSNPSPLPFIAFMLFWLLIVFVEEKRLYQAVLIGSLLGISLQLEAANAVFFIPVIGLVVLGELIGHVGKKMRRGKEVGVLLMRWLKALVFVGVGIALLLLPQALFELKHNFLSTRSLIAAFQSTHPEVSLADHLPTRFSLLLTLYGRSFFPKMEWVFAVVLVISLFFLIRYKKQLFSSGAFRVLCTWFCVVFIGHLFYTGNYTNFWDYYIIAQHIPLYLLLIHIWCTAIGQQKKVMRFVTIGVFCVWVLLSTVKNGENIIALQYPYTQRISLSLQLDAIDWIVQRRENEPFGFWAYTPSAQDDVYRYLWWYQSQRTRVLPEKHPETTRYMYLIVEDDPGYNGRRLAWIDDRIRQVGRVVTQEKFGAITVFEVMR